MPGKGSGLRVEEEGLRGPEGRSCSALGHNASGYVRVAADPSRRQGETHGFRGQEREMQEGKGREGRGKERKERERRGGEAKRGEGSACRQ